MILLATAIAGCLIFVYALTWRLLADTYPADEGDPLSYQVAIGFAFVVLFLTAPITIILFVLTSHFREDHL